MVKNALLKQKVLIKDTSIQFYKLGEVKPYWYYRQASDPFASVDIQLDVVQVRYNKLAYELTQLLAEIAGVFKALWFGCGMLVYVISKPLFMAQVLKELFMAKQPIMNDIDQKSVRRFSRMVLN